MTVYVDSMRAKVGRMTMCHMVADTSAELHAMAFVIGVRWKWVQNEGTHREHFDISLAKRRLAIQHGAVEVGWREIGKLLNQKRLERTNPHE